MTSINVINKELSSILDTMEIPDLRKKLYKENLLWLKRNLGIKNREHSKFVRAMELIDLIKNEY